MNHSGYCLWRSHRLAVRFAAAAAGFFVRLAVALTGSAAALPSNCSQSGLTVTCTFS